MISSYMRPLNQKQFNGQNSVIETSFDTAKETNLCLNWQSFVMLCVISTSNVLHYTKYLRGFEFQTKERNCFHTVFDMKLDCNIFAIYIKHGMIKRYHGYIPFVFFRSIFLMHNAIYHIWSIAFTVKMIQ